MSDHTTGVRILFSGMDPYVHERLNVLLGKGWLKLATPVWERKIHEAERLISTSSFDIIIIDPFSQEIPVNDLFKTINGSLAGVPTIYFTAKENLNNGDLQNSEDLFTEETDASVLSKAIIDQTIKNKNNNLVRTSVVHSWSLNTGEENISRKIMDGALDAIICIDARGNIVDWNPKAEKIFGWTKEEVKGTSLTDSIIPPELVNTNWNT